jgi:hypothetical protein
LVYIIKLLKELMATSAQAVTQVTGIYIAMARKKIASASTMGVATIINTMAGKDVSEVSFEKALPELEGRMSRIYSK